ncbi:protein charybde-like [Onthophagus taurus]|uniref:protein charybde-like n=1 Tax=Onthophagus taurus TaxID=166361 RepID=UPI000C1FE98A|nr:protein charybde-like [Onthophagus taurus]
MEVLQLNSVAYNISKVYDYEVYEDECESTEAAVGALSKLLETTLRSAKHSHLSCGEVVLPSGLLEEISRQIYNEADSELYGLRGCTLYLNFEGENECRKLSTIKCDQSTVSTFELTLTLKQSTAGWNSFLSQFIKKITRGGTMMISPDFKLEKRKLYRSYNV